MKKRYLIPAAALAMFVSMSLASCGSSVANAGEAFKLLSIDDLKENSSEDKKIKVEFWHSFGHNIAKELNPLIDQFEVEMAKQGIYIDVNAKSIGGGYDGLRSRVNQGTKTNSIPTMILGYPDHFADYIASDILLPLDNFVNASDKEIGFTEEDKEDFVESYWKENQMMKDNKQIIAGIPFNKSTEIMYYNASVVNPILEDNGWLVDGKWKNPTWDQLWTVSTTLKDKVSKGTCTWTYNNANYSATKTTYPVYIDSEANFFITTGRQWSQKGQDVYTKLDENGNGLVVFDNETTKTAQNYFKEKADAGLWNLPKKVNQSYGSNLMVNNEAFISIGSTAGVNNNASTKYELGVTGIPQKSYDENAVQSVIQQGTNAAILTKNSNNLTRLASWLLIRYLTSTDVTAKFSMATGYLPVRESAVDSEEFQEFLKDADSIFGGATAKAINSAYDQNDYFYTDVAFPKSSIVRDECDTMIQSIYCNNKDINKAMEDAYKRLKDYKIACDK